jgi:uncharacterized membrane protein YraQ (UPF0718 family)
MLALGRRAASLDRVLLTIGAVLLALAALDPGQLGPSVEGTARSVAHTAPFIAFAVLAVAWLRAAGAEGLVARAFEGREGRMIVMAALMGGLSPFCSCEVIPFVAALLAAGAPLSAVMAFWLASPLMDPAMFLVTAAALGTEFAVAKAVAAIGMGILGGAVVMIGRGTPVFADPLRERPARRGCCGARSPFEGRPVWAFWRHAERRGTFRDTAVENAVFLLRWLTLAYLLETLMLAYVPAGAVGAVLGGEGLRPIVLGAVLGAPAYLNGYAAVPLVGGLLEQGMAPGAAMAFVLAGGVSCIPAAVAVWPLVKPRVFAAYLGMGLLGSLLAGLAWGALA